MIHVQRDDAGAITLFQDDISLTPRKVVFVLDSPRGTLHVNALVDQTLFWGSGEQLPEDAAEVVRAFLRLPHVVMTTLTEAHNHPERESLRSFQFHTEFPETLQLYLREESSQELHRIAQVQIEGNLSSSRPPSTCTWPGSARFPSVTLRWNSVGHLGMMVARLGEQQELLPGVMVRIYPEGKEPKPARGTAGPRRKQGGGWQGSSIDHPSTSIRAVGPAEESGAPPVLVQLLRLSTSSRRGVGHTGLAAGTAPRRGCAAAPRCGHR
jgi:hypothetical protein